jgi:hypothetical protein
MLREFYNYALCVFARTSLRVLNVTQILKAHSLNTCTGTTLNYHQIIERVENTKMPNI